MKKDIEIPVAKDVHVAIVHEWSEEFLSKDWNAYIINNRTTPIDMVLIVSKGYDGTTKTSTMRHGIGFIAPKSFEKIELVQEEVFKLTNEFFVTFFAEDKLFERKYIFPKNSISEKNLTSLPLLEKDGILAE
ncbi:hypothetical protein [Cellulophaga tyrosinoxydans]|uniref:Phenylalanyl-tRNA synthetase subunit alpha n=1 Tax=Cellulophaga tyrosinoxydans TaxID=504486 RepID=A0A1W1Z121_9FLAO|nr:hypothetical protein [Cellulophaga tyrosinoxydans]SMC42155.1 hypothetical protein SAMN05660703_1033 [Cellulophaga tyrosinoxydans]